MGAQESSADLGNDPSFNETSTSKRQSRQAKGFFGDWHCHERMTGPYRERSRESGEVQQSVIRFAEVEADVTTQRTIVDVDIGCRRLGGHEARAQHASNSLVLTPSTCIRSASETPGSIATPIATSSPLLVDHSLIVEPVGTWSELPPTREVSLEESSADAVLWWRRSLETGASVFLDEELVFLTVDTELGCLEVREHECLYPLAELKTSEQPCVDRGSANMNVGMFQCVASFAELDALNFKFNEAAQRDAFAATLNQLAKEARRGEISSPKEALFDGQPGE